jgi:hypothetical protein
MLAEGLLVPTTQPHRRRRAMTFEEWVTVLNAG